MVLPRRALSVMLAVLLVLTGLTGCTRRTSSETALNPDPAGGAPANAAPPQTADTEPDTAAEPEPAEPEPVLPATPELPGALWVMVSNSPEARPQSGLDRASWVYELEAEGGITRFLAGFYHRETEKIGPVRSVRYYYLEIVKAYGGPIAHAGASPEALSMLAGDRSYQDLDEIYNAGGYFWRSKDRQMPHNLYTSTERLLQGVKAKQYTLRPLPDWPTGELSGGEPAKRVKLDFPMDVIHVEWRWQEGRYVRYQSGTPHAMQDGAVIKADNILVLKAARYKNVKGDDGVWRREIGMVGEGQGYFFAGGKTWPIQWRKDSAGEPFQFTVGDQPLALVPGITWVEVIPGADAIRISNE